MVDLASRKVVVATELCVREPFVMAQIKVGLGTVIGHKYLAVLKGIHGARIYINVWIKFLKGNGQPTTLKKGTDGCRRKSLSQR
jgi:hypothetical protein